MKYEEYIKKYLHDLLVQHIPNICYFENVVKLCWHNCVEKYTYWNFLKCIQLQNWKYPNHVVKHHDVTIYSSFNESCTKLKELKYKLILLIKTISQCDATCVVLLKSSVCLKVKFGLFVGSSCIICMLQNFSDSTLLQNSSGFFQI